VEDARTPAPIIVVGSVNQDYIIRVPHPPAAGESVLGKALLKQPGGLGANQAVAAARLRGSVSLIASIGDDPEGAFILRALRSEGIDTANVEMVDRGMTGLALICVSDDGENSFTKIPGVNSSLTAERVEATVTRLTRDAGRSIVVVQGDMLPAVIESALLAAEKAGGRAVFNLCPFVALAENVHALCDPLVVSKNEAGMLVGWEVRDAADADRAAAQILPSVRSVVVSLGAAGASWADSAAAGHVPAPTVPQVVDTIGAPDAFVGALAAFLAAGESLPVAVAAGVEAGSFALQGPGAQSSFPSLEDLRLDPKGLIPPVSGQV
jgi:ribokinase